MGYEEIKETEEMRRSPSGGGLRVEAKHVETRSVIQASAALSAGLFNTAAYLIALKAGWQNINLDEWICIILLPGQSITISASG